MICIWRALNLFRGGSSELCTGFPFTGFCLDARSGGSEKRSSVGEKKRKSKKKISVQEQKVRPSDVDIDQLTRDV